MTTKSTKSNLPVLALLTFGAMFLLFDTYRSAVAQSQGNDGGYVLVRINCFEIRALPVDLADGDVAELQLMVIVTDGEQVNGTFTFFQNSSSSEVRPVRAGERFCDTDAAGPWFAVDEALDQVAVWFIALDSDDLSLIESGAVDIGSIAPIELLAKGLKALVGDSGVLSILSRSNLVTAVLDFAFNRALEVWELPDTIGEYQTVLWRRQGWNLGTYTAVSVDRNIVIEYDILSTNETPQTGFENPGEPTRAPATIVWSEDHIHSLSGTMSLGSADAWTVFQVWDGINAQSTIHGVIEPGKQLLVPAPLRGTFWTITGITYEDVVQRALEMRTEALEQGLVTILPPIIFVGDGQVPDGFSNVLPPRWHAP